jgi:uncharacterized protein
MMIARNISYSQEQKAVPARRAMRNAIVRRPAQPLANEDRRELLEFLAVRPLHTVIMAGMVVDNGVESPLNRGTFYAYRNAAGILEGVALIGHVSLIEARSHEAVEALAGCAQNYRDTHLIVIQQDQFNLFWSFYSDRGQPLRLLNSDLLFEVGWPAAVHELVPGLRPATLDDTDLVLSVQAEMAFEQSSVDPLKQDPQGFRERITRRIKQERIFVWIEEGRLIFKADILAETPEMIYLEGIWVNAQERGRGYGLRCISQLSRELLSRAPGVCVFASENNQVAHNFYRKAGYKLRDFYTLAYVGRA